VAEKTSPPQVATKPEVAARSEPKPVAKATAPSPLAMAGASSDAAVHALLAERETARLNEDADRLAAVDDQLAGLGYAAG
jgi:hypothetical protein